VRVGGLVLAAGAGSRFGGTKQLAPVRGRPLLEHAIAAVAGLEPRVVVLGHAAAEIRDGVDLQGATPVVCASWEQGQSASLRCGIAALGDVDAAVVVLGDQPLIGPEAVAALVAAARPGDDAVRASYDGTPGHPVLLGRTLLARAAELTGDTGFRDLLTSARRIDLTGVADPADVDTREHLTSIAGPATTPDPGNSSTADGVGRETPGRGSATGPSGGNAKN
jgi:CTP:molybdopterin cytidylyltransferase MocA